jgi:hypothetical protein
MIETEVETQLKQQNIDLKNNHQRLENEMKTKITQIYNSTSKFFWYPPKELLTEKNFREKEQIVKNQEFPGFGISYTKSSVPVSV